MQNRKTLGALVTSKAGQVLTMSNSKSSTEIAKANLIVRAERLGRPPLAWTWSIRTEADEMSLDKGKSFYRSAEDAWAAGKVELQRVHRTTGLPAQ